MNTEKNIQQILIEDIIPNRFQPRLAFDEEGLKELSESIKQHGIIQPLVLRRLGKKYEIIAGERRYKASQMAGLKTVPAIISNIDDNESAEIALIENIQRRNLTSIEEAKSYQNLLDRGYLTQEQLAQKMGVSQSTIANKLRLLNLSKEVQDALLQEKISERHARSLLAIPKEEQSEWLKKILSKRMTVRQLDLEIKKAKGGPSEELPQIEVSPDNDMNNNNENNQIEQLEPIEQLETEPEEPIINKERAPRPTTPKKFFNFLEDEATNMTMEMEEEEPKEVEQLEMLEDIEPEEKIENEKIVPFFDEQQEKNNQIEEIYHHQEEEIIDPLDSIEKLEPGYLEKQKAEQGMDLKTAINEVREFVKKLEEKGFEIQIEEIDLEQSYQITFNIKK